MNRPAFVSPLSTAAYGDSPAVIPCVLQIHRRGEASPVSPWETRFGARYPQVFPRRAPLARVVGMGADSRRHHARARGSAGPRPYGHRERGLGPVLCCSDIFDFAALTSWQRRDS